MFFHGQFSIFLLQRKKFYKRIRTPIFRVLAAKQAVQSFSNFNVFCNKYNRSFVHIFQSSR